MNAAMITIRDPVVMALAAVALCLGLAAPATGLRIELPAETAKLRSGPGSELATRQCLGCHSADTISIQPPGKPLAFWKAEVEKMRKVYGAQIPDDQIDPIAHYLTREYGDGKL